MDDNGFESINVIPFIDIMLVLLTIVLTTSTFIATGAIGVQLPKAAPTSAPVMKCLNIVIDRSGHIYLNDARIAIDHLDSHMSGESRETPILLRADCRLPLQEFVTVMDRLRQLGFTRISLQAESTL